MITTHSSFFSSSCSKGSPKITYPHKQPAQAGKTWNPVWQWSLLRGWRHLTVTAVLPLAQLSCHAWMLFFQQAPATSDQQDYLHLHHSPNLQKTSYEPNIPSSAQHRFQSPVNQEHLPASELHTYLFNLKERPLPFISRLCCFFYAVAFRGLFCSRNGKYFTSQQFVQEASTHSSIFQPCQPCDKVWPLESSSPSHQVTHCLGYTQLCTEFYGKPQWPPTQKEGVGWHLVYRSTQCSKYVETWQWWPKLKCLMSFYLFS